MLEQLSLGFIPIHRQKLRRCSFHDNLAESRERVAKQLALYIRLTDLISCF